MTEEQKYPRTGPVAIANFCNVVQGYYTTAEALTELIIKGVACEMEKSGGVLSEEVAACANRTIFYQMRGKGLTNLPPSNKFSGATLTEDGRQLALDSMEEWEAIDHPEKRAEIMKRKKEEKESDQ